MRGVTAGVRYLTLGNSESDSQHWNEAALKSIYQIGWDSLKDGIDATQSRFLVRR